MDMDSVLRLANDGDTSVKRSTREGLQCDPLEYMEDVPSSESVDRD